MNIFEIITRNLGKRPRTRKPKDTVPYPAGFRGELKHDAGMCTACGTCSYVCSPRAIRQEYDEEAASWMYDAGRCTYCGKCVEYCPTGALTFANHSGKLVLNRAEQKTYHTVPFQACERCGELMIPLPVESLSRLYATPESAREAAPAHRLCPKCRARLTSERIKTGLSGPK